MRPDELKDMLASIGMDMLFAKELMVRLPAPFSFSIVRVVTSFVSLSYCLQAMFVEESRDAVDRMEKALETEQDTTDMLFVVQQACITYSILCIANSTFVWCLRTHQPCRIADPPPGAQLAHRMKGSSALIHLVSFQRICEIIECTVKRGRLAMHHTPRRARGRSPLLLLAAQRKRHPTVCPATRGGRWRLSSPPSHRASTCSKTTPSRRVGRLQGLNRRTTQHCLVPGSIVLLRAQVMKNQVLHGSSRGGRTHHNAP